MKYFKDFFTAIFGWFTSGKAKQDLALVAQYLPKALPYIDLLAQVTTSITPTPVDDAAYAFVRQRYPQLFDGSIRDKEDINDLAFRAASDLLKRQYPALSDTVARAATQLAYIEHKGNQP